MTVYNVVLFVHITSVIVMFASLTADGLAIGGLRATDPAEPARAWIRVLGISAAVGPWARLAVLGAGLYLAVDAWSWQGWIIVGLIGWTAFVILGEPLTGRELREMRALVQADHDILPPAATTRLRHPRMWSAVLIRAGLGIGIVFCMAVKPPAAAAAGAAAAGALAGVVDAEEALRAKFSALLSDLDERAQRLYLGSEARALGHGGVAAVARASGVSRVTVAAGAAELEAGTQPLGRVRRPGGGRKRAADLDRELVPALTTRCTPPPRRPQPPPQRPGTSPTAVNRHSRN